LLAVISDRQSGKMTLRRIDFSPQRPRRYLQPAVGYNSSLEQIEIEVAAADPSLVPASGIRVLCEFTEVLPPGTEAQLDGIIAAPDYKAKLFARVPARLARVYTAMLHVDGYPRAFLYQIPCTIQSNNLSELNDVMDIRIIAPQAGTRLKAPTEGIEARIEVDAPLGSFPANQRRDFIDVGVDADRDRELQNDPSIRLYCDRQVEIIGEGLDVNGVLAFTAKVQDYQLLVPCPGLINVRANLLARLNVSTSGRWSKDIEVVLDATPPQIDRVELTPGRAVAAEQDLELSVWASDANLSGVRQVEVALDKDGSGDFGEVNQPVAAKSTTGIRWSASLSTKDVPQGPAVVLIRATDRVGNVSKVRTELIQLVAASELPSTSSPTMGTVTGVVTFLGVPIPDARVQLTPTQASTTAANPAAATNSADAAQPPQPQQMEAKTDETGTFRLENVAPGQYTVTAKGLARNRVRKVTQEVTVEPGPLRLSLETR
jgi:hypothetical protein